MTTPDLSSCVFEIVQPGRDPQIAPHVVTKIETDIEGKGAGNAIVLLAVELPDASGLRK